MAKGSHMPFRLGKTAVKMGVKRRRQKDVQRSVVLQGLRHLKAPAVT